MDCCLPLETIETSGIDFESLECLARCNGLAVIAQGANQTTLNEFRERVKALSKVDTAFMALSYSRKALNQTGDGHWSPMGAYEASSDMVLILDQARFKYNSHWVPLSTLFNAMNTIDSSTGKTRGYLELTPCDKENGPPPAAQPFSMCLCGSLRDVRSKLQNLPSLARSKWVELASKPDSTTTEAAKQLALFLGDYLESIIIPNGSMDVVCCTTTGAVSSEPPHANEMADLYTDDILKELETTRTYQRMMSNPQTGNVLWRTVLVLSLDKPFWESMFASLPESSTLVELMYESISSESHPRLLENVTRVRGNVRRLIRS